MKCSFILAFATFFTFLLLSFVPPVQAQATNQPPEIYPLHGQYYYDLIGQEVTVHNDAVDPEGQPVTFYWDLDNNGSYETTGQDAVFSAVGKTKGEYDIWCKAVDSEGAYDIQGSTVYVDDGITIDDFVLLALDSMWLKKDVNVSGGHVGVQNSGSTALLHNNVELTLAAKVTIPDLTGGDQDSDFMWWRGDHVYANRIWAGPKTYLPTIHYNQLTASPSATIWRQNRPGGYTNPTFPLVAHMPTFPTFAAGSTDVVIATSSSQTLPAGNYRNLDVMPNAELRLTGGTYNFKSWDLKTNSRLYFTAPTEVHITGRLKTADLVEVRNDPIPTTTWDFSKVFVKGKNGDTGDMDDGPKAVNIGESNIFNGNIYAPNGTIVFQDKNVGNGAFIGKWLVANPGSNFGWQNTFAP